MILGLKNGSATWLCPTCRRNSNSSIIDADNDDDEEVIHFPDNPNIGDVVLILKSIQRQLDSLKNSFNFVCRTIDEVRDKTTQLTKDYRCVNHKLEDFEKRYVAQESKLNYMEAELDRTYQNANKCNIVIAGLSLHGDTHIPIINMIANTGVVISTDDIIEIKQMVHSNDTKSLLKNSFIVTFKSVELKTKILTSFRNSKNPIYNKDIAAHSSGQRPSQKVYVMDHLTKYQSRLYNEAKKIKI